MKSGPSRNRQFGILRNGFMVLGPRAMAANDLVCSLQGGELAYVLRPAGDEYLFLGECFVYTLSDGFFFPYKYSKKMWFSLI